MATLVTKTEASQAWDSKLTTSPCNVALIGRLKNWNVGFFLGHLLQSMYCVCVFPGVKISRFPGLKFEKLIYIT